LRCGIDGSSCAPARPPRNDKEDRMNNETNEVQLQCTVDQTQTSVTTAIRSPFYSHSTAIRPRYNLSTNYS